MAKGKRPTPKSQKDISKSGNTPYHVDNIQGGNLQDPNKSEFDKENRGNHLSFKDDTAKPLSISLMDIDEAVIYYLENIIKPRVQQNGSIINVPILYGDSERWSQIQKNGYLRDKKNQILLPTIVFKRTNIEPNKSLTSKVDANNPHNYNVFTKSYNRRNTYDNFTQLTNRKPEKEYHAVVVPDYVTLNYSFVISTHYVEQMNTIIEAINYASDSYWGDPAKFKFKATIDSYANTVELPADGQRVVKTTFSLKLHGYIVPDVIQKDLTSIKKFNNKTQLIFGVETIQNNETLNVTTPLAFSSGKPIFPGDNTCQPVTITQNGVFYKYQDAGTTFNYISGSAVCADGVLTITDESGSTLKVINVVSNTSSSTSILDTYIHNYDYSFTSSIDAQGSGSIPDINITVNSTSSATIPSVKDYNLVVKSDSGDLIGEPSGSEWIVQIPNTKTVTFLRPPSSIDTSYALYDAGWRQANGHIPTLTTDNFVQQLDPTTPWKILYDDSATTGITEHLYRFVGINGGYAYRDTDDSTTLYKDKDGNISDEATVFTKDGNRLMIDRLTGIAIAYRDLIETGGNKAPADFYEQMWLTENLAGYAGNWFAMSEEEMVTTFVNGTIKNSLYNVWRQAPFYMPGPNLTSTANLLNPAGAITLMSMSLVHDPQSWPRTQLTATGRYYVPCRTFEDWPLY